MATPVDECHARVQDALRVLRNALTEKDPFHLRSHLLLANHHVDCAISELGHAFRQGPPK